MLAKLQWPNLALRAVMELGIIVGLGYWGYQVGGNLGTKLLLAVGAPVIGFGFWGMVDFHQAGQFAEPLRLLQELIISIIAALALYITGQRALGVTLALISIVYHILVYMTGGTLLHDS